MASENEVKILVTTETDLRDAEELQNVIDEVQEKVDAIRSEQLQLQFEADTQAVEEAENEIEELKALIEAAESDPVHIPVDGEEIEAAKERVEELEQSLLALQATAANSELNMLKDLASDAEEAKNSIDGVTESASGLESAMGAVGGAAAAAGLMEMVDTAGRINDSWNQLGLTFGTVTDDMKADMDSAAAATGRSGGTIRDYFNQMGIAGVKNTDLLTQSFESLSGRAYQTGNSIETMENSMKRMVMSGNAGARQLTQLGITTEDLGRAMGVSADEASKAFSALSQEDRLRVLTQAMGDGKQANEEYKNSWQGVKDQASAAFAGLMGAVGTPILQMLIPIMQGATKVVKFLSDAFKALPGPLQAVIGGIGAGAAIFAAFAGAIGVAGQIISGLSSGIQVIKELSLVSKALGAVRTVLTTINEALAISEWAALGPILLVVAAVVALIAILWYLYNTNEDVRKAIDNFIAGLKEIPGVIYGAVMGAFEWLKGAWQNTVDWFNNGGQAIHDAVTGTFQWISDTIYGTLTGAFTWLQESWQGVVDWFSQGGQTIQDTLGGAWQWLVDSFNNVVNTIQTYAPLVAQVLFVMATGGVGAIILLVANFMGMPNQVGGALQNVISRVLTFASNLVNNFRTTAINAVNGFINNIKALPGALAAELQEMYNQAVNWLNRIVDKIKEAALRMVEFWKWGSGEQSPGFMYDAFHGELKAMESAAKSIRVPGLMGQAGQDMVQAWGNPKLSYSMELDQVDVDQKGAFDNSRLESLLSKILDAINNRPIGTGNVTLNHYGDTDKEEKLNEILDFIVKQMNFDNATAGRTV